jgi:hypothetical protein
MSVVTLLVILAGLVFVWSLLSQYLDREQDSIPGRFQNVSASALAECRSKNMRYVSAELRDKDAYATICMTESPVKIYTYLHDGETD